MRYFVLLFVLFGVTTLGLSGCGGNSDSDTSKTASVQATTISGNTVALNGTYKSNCHYSTGGQTYIYLTLEFSGTRMHQTADIYDTSDSTCTGNISTFISVDLDFNQANTIVNSSSWVDNAGIAATAPLAGDGSAQLLDIEPASVFDFTALGSELGYTAGQNFQKFIVVDDTGTQTKLYFAHNYPTDNTVEMDPAYTKQ